MAPSTRQVSQNMSMRGLILILWIRPWRLFMSCPWVSLAQVCWITISTFFYASYSPLLLLSANYCQWEKHLLLFYMCVLGQKQEHIYFIDNDWEESDSILYISHSAVIVHHAGFGWNVVKASKTVSHRRALVFPLKQQKGKPCSVILFLCLNMLPKSVCGAEVNKAKANSQKCRNPRPGLVPWMMIRVVIPALGYQSSRTGVVQAMRL